MTGDALKGNRGRASFCFVFEQVFVFQKKCASFLRNPGDLSSGNHEVWGEIFQVSHGEDNSH